MNAKGNDYMALRKISNKLTHIEQKQEIIAIIMIESSEQSHSCWNQTMISTACQTIM